MATTNDGFTQWTVDRLSTLLGLDVESIQTQLLPSLEAQKTADDAESHLFGIVGHGEDIDAFVTQYLQKRFGKRPVGPAVPPDAVTSLTVVKKRPPGQFISDGPPQRSAAVVSTKKTVSLSRPKSPSSSPAPRKITFTRLNPRDPEITEDQIDVLLHLLSLPPPSISSKKRLRRKCFCRARIHPVSKLSPICFNCGLPLCAMTRPNYGCPFCTQPVLTEQARSDLVANLLAKKEDIQALLRAEAREAQQAANTTLQMGPISSSHGRENYAGKAGGRLDLAGAAIVGETADVQFPAMPSSKVGESRAASAPKGRIMTLDKHGRANIVREAARKKPSEDRLMQKLFDDSDDEGMVAVPL